MCCEREISIVNFCSLLGGHSHGVVQDAHDHETKQHLTMDHAHGHNHGTHDFDHSSSILNKGISKYGEHGKSHEARR